MLRLKSGALGTLAIAALLAVAAAPAHPEGDCGACGIRPGCGTAFLNQPPPKKGEETGKIRLVLGGPAESAAQETLRQALARPGGLCVEVRAAAEGVIAIIRDNHQLTADPFVKAARDLGYEVRGVSVDNTTRSADGLVARASAAVGLDSGEGAADLKTAAGTSPAEAGTVSAGSARAPDEAPAPPSYVALVAQPVRTSLEATRLRSTLLRVPGVRSVDLQPFPGRPGTAQVGIGGAQVSSAALAQAARACGVQLGVR